MNPSKQILISGTVIGAIGALHAIISKKPLSTAIHGTVIFVSLLAIAEALSPTHFGALAASLASLAALVAVIVELPEILTHLGV
jgi:hypothetical protein